MSDRGQTNIDFLMGMMVFLLAVGFVFSFLPTMFEPFGGSGVDDALIADRSAAQLAEGTLVSDPTTPNVLDSERTTAFFEDDHCPVESIGIDGRNVRIAIGPSDGPATVNDTELVCGEEPPPGASVSASQRLVSIDGEDHLLSVRVW